MSDEIEFIATGKPEPRQREVTMKGWFTYNPDDPQLGYKGIFIDQPNMPAYKPTASDTMRVIRIAITVELP